MGKPITPPEVTEKIKQMLISGKTMEYIKNATGASISTIHRIAKKYDIQKQTKMTQMPDRWIREWDALHRQNMTNKNILEEEQ